MDDKEVMRWVAAEDPLDIIDQYSVEEKSRFPIRQIPDTELFSLNKARLGPNFEDKVQLKSKDGNVFAHGRVLASASSYFNTLCASETKDAAVRQVLLSQFSTTCVTHFVDFLYTGVLNVNLDDHLIDLYRLACHLHNNSFEINVCRLLLKKNRSDAGVFKLFEFASQFGSSLLFKVLGPTFFHQLGSDCIEEHLSFTTLREFSRNALNVSHQQNVRIAVTKWARLHPDHKIDDILNCLPPLKESAAHEIRFPVHVHFVTRFKTIQLCCFREGKPLRVLGEVDLPKDRMFSYGSATSYIGDNLFVASETDIMKINFSHPELCEKISLKSLVLDRPSFECVGLKGMCAAPNGLLVIIEDDSSSRGRTASSPSFLLLNYDVKSSQVRLLREFSDDHWDRSCSPSPDEPRDIAKCFYYEDKVIFTSNKGFGAVCYSDPSREVPRPCPNFKSDKVNLPKTLAMNAATGEVYILDDIKLPGDQFRVKAFGLSGNQTMSVTYGGEAFDDKRGEIRELHGCSDLNNCMVFMGSFSIAKHTIRSPDHSPKSEWIQSTQKFKVVSMDKRERVPRLADARWESSRCKFLGFVPREVFTNPLICKPDK